MSDVQGLNLPDRPSAIDPAIWRNLRAIEDWANAPHRVYGNRIVSPCYFGEDNTSHAFTAPDNSSGFAGEGTDIYTAVTVEVERRMRAFIWGVAEFDNTDAATDYRAWFFLPVEVDGVRSNGRAVRQHQNNGTLLNAQLDNLRSFYIDTLGRAEVKFQWGWKVNPGPNDITVFRQKMIVALFEAPDVDANTPVVWTTSAITQAAYRVLDTDE